MSSPTIKYRGYRFDDIGEEEFKEAREEAEKRLAELEQLKKERKEKPKKPVPEKEVISWEEGKDCVGKIKKIKGTIVQTYATKKRIYLNFHPDYEKYLTAVIFWPDLDQFPSEPEDYYRGKAVVITGRIELWRERLVVRLCSPSQIIILDGEESTQSE